MVKTLPPKKGSSMATVTAPIRRNSAQQELLNKFGKLIDEAEATMSVREFHKASKKSSEALKKALNHRKRKTGTA